MRGFGAFVAVRPKRTKRATVVHLGNPGFILAMLPTGGNPVTEADERAKLGLCVEAARQIWM